MVLIWFKGRNFSTVCDSGKLFYFSTNRLLMLYLKTNDCYSNNYNIALVNSER